MHDMDDTQQQLSADEQQLRVLVWLHYALGGITAVFAPFGAYIVYLGWPLLYPPEGTGAYRGPQMFDPLLWGAALVTLGTLWASMCLMHGALLAYVGRCIARRRRRKFSIVFSLFDLTYAPLGTGLAIYALVLLTRPGVKELFK